MQNHWQSAVLTLPLGNCIGDIAGERANDLAEISSLFVWVKVCDGDQKNVRLFGADDH